MGSRPPPPAGETAPSPGTDAYGLYVNCIVVRTIEAVHPRDNAHDSNRNTAPVGRVKAIMMNVRDGHALVVCLPAKYDVRCN